MYLQYYTNSDKKLPYPSTDNIHIHIEQLKLLIDNIVKPSYTLIYSYFNYLHSYSNLITVDLQDTFTSMYKKLNVLHSSLIKNTFKNRLTSLMYQQNLISSDIEQLLFVSQQTVNDYLNGKSIPSYDKLIILSNYLGCSLDYLLNDNIDTVNYKEDYFINLFGLSDSNIQFLKNLEKDDFFECVNICKTLNTLLENHFMNKGSLSCDVLHSLTLLLNKSIKEDAVFIIKDSDLNNLHLQLEENTHNLSKLFFDFKNTLIENNKGYIHTPNEFKYTYLHHLENTILNLYDKVKQF